jgi:hypothetical protein
MFNKSKKSKENPKKNKKKQKKTNKKSEEFWKMNLLNFSII